MRKSVVLPILAFVGGAGGFLLRRWELASAFEPDTGLPIPGAPAAWALIALSVAMLAVFMGLCRGKHNPFPKGYDGAFAAKGNTLYISAMVLSAALLLVSGVLELMGLSQAYATASMTQGINPMLSTLPKALLAVLTLGCVFCVLSVGKNGYRGEGKGKFKAALLMPAYMACLWLISAYQTRAGDPVRQDYIYELLAIIAALLGFYFTAGFSFEKKGKVFFAALFSLMGVYLSLTTLADAHDLPTLLLYAFSILYLTAQVTALTYNDGRMPGVSAASTPETEIETEETPDEG